MKSANQLPIKATRDVGAWNWTGLVGSRHNRSAINSHTPATSLVRTQAATGAAIGLNSRSCVSTAQMIRAVFFAIATAATLAGRRTKRFANQLADGDLSRAYR